MYCLFFICLIICFVQRDRCTPELRLSNLHKANMLTEKVKDLLKNWKGPVSVQMTHSEAMKLTSTLKTVDKGKGNLINI